MQKFYDLPEGVDFEGCTKIAGRWRIFYDDGLVAACPFADEIEVDTDTRMIHRAGFLSVRLTPGQMELFDALYLSGPLDRGELFARLYDYRPVEGDASTVAKLSARLEKTQERIRRALLPLKLSIDSADGVFSLEKF